MNKPLQKFRAGAVQASVWSNETTKNGTPTEYKTVTFERRYKDKEGNWQSASSLHVRDIPNVMVVLGKAYEELVLKQEDALAE